MKRVIVIGSPGAGKSTFFRRLRDKIDKLLSASGGAERSFMVG